MYLARLKAADRKMPVRLPIFTTLVVKILFKAMSTSTSLCLPERKGNCLRSFCFVSNANTQGVDVMVFILNIVKQGNIGRIFAICGKSP